MIKEQGGRKGCTASDRMELLWYKGKPDGKFQVTIKVEGSSSFVWVPWLKEEGDMQMQSACWVVADPGREVARESGLGNGQYGTLFWMREKHEQSR